MSSRLIPPKDGAIAATASTISSTSLVDSTIGTADRPPNSLNRQALPSMTGRDGGRADVAEARARRVPSETTATTRGAQVKRRASAGSAAMALETRATPGV